MSLKLDYLINPVRRNYLLIQSNIQHKEEQDEQKNDNEEKIAWKIIKQLVSFPCRQEWPEFNGFPLE
jgi:hypothetical protein